MTVTSAVVIALILGPTAWLMLRGERAALREPPSTCRRPATLLLSPANTDLPSAHRSRPL
ncbi:hypothetical protein ACFYO6_12945 [Streptomyces anthocyanicus]|jgi:hypothetical protein|uniref:hypothetical protein n=1 Tax=Streptomyces TaxID=1883 RepID=UPI0013CFB8C9|nr:hypothetical protein [Streptomyces sp. KMM 9044]NEA95281.1 hypothetical protein [Actinospica acidiphila]WAX76977.1 hypothetical protein HUV60_004190 [Streptomyces sp. KMM 9044]